jgi:hypothetical protein
MQTAPSSPQAPFEVPALQVLPMQQPAQVVGPQGVTQAPLSHTVPAAQLAHATPPVPHAVFEFPGWHWLF